MVLLAAREEVIPALKGSSTRSHTRALLAEPLRVTLGFNPGALAQLPRLLELLPAVAPPPLGVSILAASGDAAGTSGVSERRHQYSEGQIGSRHFFISFLCPQKPEAHMAGLEVLFASAAPAITCAQDALVCFLHWEVVTHGYYSLGAGDQVRHGDGSGPGWRG